MKSAHPEPVEGRTLPHFLLQGDKTIEVAWLV